MAGWLGLAFWGGLGCRKIEGRVMAKEMEGKKRGWQQEAAKLEDVLIYIFLEGGKFL